ncbi:unnamed protein product [Closterium sp. NIES-53]
MALVKLPTFVALGCLFVAVAFAMGKLPHFNPYAAHNAPRLALPHPQSRYVQQRPRTRLDRQPHALPRFHPDPFSSSSCADAAVVTLSWAPIARPTRCPIFCPVARGPIAPFVVLEWGKVTWVAGVGDAAPATTPLLRSRPPFPPSQCCLCTSRGVGGRVWGSRVCDGSRPSSLNLPLHFFFSSSSS